MARPERDLGYGGPHDPGVDLARARSEAAGDTAIDPIAAGGGGSIRVGTASWTDPTMTASGVFYPPSASSAEDRLQFYASRFPIVEVDATYYALPARRTAELWRDRTPPDFVFDVKAHALMTGQPTETRRLPKEIRTALPSEIGEKPRIYSRDLPPDAEKAIWTLFADGLRPLEESGQLGSVLMQYPRWFFPVAESRDAILRARELLDLPIAVEFRNASWFNEKNLDRTMRFLGDHAIPFVMVDGPQGFRSSVPPIDAVTSPDLAIVRFHGRRTDTWEARGIPTVERFRYLYEPEELEPWVPRIQRAASTARDTHVLMNNCYANYGSTNAREIAKLLADIKLGGSETPDAPDETAAGGA